MHHLQTLHAVPTLHHWTMHPPSSFAIMPKPHPPQCNRASTFPISNPITCSSPSPMIVFDFFINDPSFESRNDVQEHIHRIQGHIYLCKGLKLMNGLSTVTLVSVLRQKSWFWHWTDSRGDDKSVCLASRLNWDNDDETVLLDAEDGGKGEAWGWY